MAAKKVAAIIVAALVAGVVLGTLGIANAGNKVTLPGASADCTSCPGETGAAASADCGDCSEGQAVAAPAANAPAGAQACPSGAVGTTGACDPAAMPEGACGTGGCPSE